MCKESILLGVLNFVFGFGVIYFFWYVADKSQEVKGLFDYYAATFGDAIFLTGIIVCGWYFIKINKAEISHCIHR